MPQYRFHGQSEGGLGGSAVPLGRSRLGLLRAYWLQKFYDRRRTFPKIKGTYLKKLPQCRIDPGNIGQKAKHDRMVALVEQMLSLRNLLGQADSDQSREVLHAQTDATDAEIDKLVYDLYGLTGEEIALVEQAAL